MHLSEPEATLPAELTQNSMFVMSDVNSVVLAFLCINSSILFGVCSTRLILTSRCRFRARCLNTGPLRLLVCTAASTASSVPIVWLSADPHTNMQRTNAQGLACDDKFLYVHTAMGLEKMGTG